MLIHAAWCGHCQKFKPLYQDVARRLRHVQTLEIMQIDGSKNDLGEVSVSAYPTIFFFPAGAGRTDLVPYRGDHSTEASVKEMVRWLHLEATHDFDDLPQPLPATAGSGEEATQDSEQGLLGSEDDL